MADEKVRRVIPEKVFEFSVTLIGRGPDAQAAWNNAVEGFNEDPGAVDEEEATLTAEVCEDCLEEVAPGSLDVQGHCEGCRPPEVRLVLCANCDADITAGVGRSDECCSDHCANRLRGNDCPGPCAFCKDDESE